MAGETLPSGSTNTQGLADWAAPYITNYLGQAQALSQTPYQVYQGPLTAGASELQSNVFKGLAGLTFPSNLGQTFSSTGAYQMPTLQTPSAAGTAPTTGITAADTTPAAPAGPTGIAANYMNPYLQAVLDPQLAELRRQNDITNMNTNAKLTGAGAFGGSRQAIMNAENNRNLMQEMNKTVGQGYASAYDKAMQQFNTEQGQAKDIVGLLSNQGATQRGIEAEGVEADYAQFEEERDFPYKQVQYQQSLLQDLPISAAQTEYIGQSDFAKLLGYGGTLAELAKELGLID